MSLPTASTSLAPQVAQTATIALRGRVVRSGTRIRASYRWQPTRLVTAVNPYASFGDQAYFSCHLRQALRLGSLLPNGLDATVDVTNLMAQGYRPFLSADGQTLFLAQSPRTVQGGIDLVVRCVGPCHQIEQGCKSAFHHIGFLQPGQAAAARFHEKRCVIQLRRGISLAQDRETPVLGAEFVGELEERL